IARAKTRLVAEAVYRRDSQSSLARYFGSGLATGLGMEQLLGWSDAIERVGEADIRAALRRLGKKRSGTGHLAGGGSCRFGWRLPLMRGLAWPPWRFATSRPKYLLLALSSRKANAACRARASGTSLLRTRRS